MSCHWLAASTFYLLPTLQRWGLATASFGPQILASLIMNLFMFLWSVTLRCFISVCWLSSHTTFRSLSQSLKRQVAFPTLCDTILCCSLQYDCQAPVSIRWYTSRPTISRYSHILTPSHLQTKQILCFKMRWDNLTVRLWWNVARPLSNLLNLYELFQ